MTPAPIGLSTYSRLDHLKQTVAALQRNALAIETELYVFSDGPREGDEERVRNVRNFLRTIDGFKKIEIIEREQNNRVYNNRQGIRMLLDSHGKMIYLEEDVVTAPAFLQFMNRALDAYQDNPRIFSIAGYCPPIDIPKDYPYDVFLHPRFNPWGFGIWKDRFDRIEMKIPGPVMKDIFLHPANLYRFSRGGLDMVPLALNNYFGYTDGFDVKAFTQEFALGMLTVYPVVHLVDNIGIDGSGLHRKRKPGYRVPLSNEKVGEISLPISLEPDSEIMREFFQFRSGNFHNRIRLALWSILILLKRGLLRFGERRS